MGNLLVGEREYRARVEVLPIGSIVQVDINALMGALVLRLTPDEAMDLASGLRQAASQAAIQGVI